MERNRGYRSNLEASKMNMTMSSQNRYNNAFFDKAWGSPTKGAKYAD